MVEALIWIGLAIWIPSSSWLVVIEIPRAHRRALFGGLDSTP